MEFKTEQYTYTIPDRPTVRQQLMYSGLCAERADEELILKHWEGAKLLIQTWSSTILPDYKVDLDKVSDPSQASIISAIGLEVRQFMNALEDLPKNS